MEALINACILGIVEGLTEFLPISSTGHLIVTASLMSMSGEDIKAFIVVIQLGAILAVCWDKRSRLLDTLVNVKKDLRSRSFLINVAMAFLPTAIIALLLHDTVKSFFFSPITVALMLVIGGIAILLLENRQGTPSVNTLDEVHWSQAIKIGLIQALAIFPGVSRSGATILGGMYVGLSRTAATEFSFFLAIPVMIAATGYDLIKNTILFRPEIAATVLVGFITSFAFGLATVRALTYYVSRNSFKPFGYYRILAGLTILFSWEAGILDWTTL